MLKFLPVLKSSQVIAALMYTVVGWSALSVASAQPGDDVGKVIFVFGTANLERSNVVPLTKGLGLQARDKVTTGSNGRAQLRMVDDSKVALRPGSEFVVEKIVRNAAASGSVVAAGNADEQVVFQLLKGGLRTLTGTVGGKNEGDYQLKTPVATLGIRGTAYSVVLADPSECISAGGSPGKSAVALYVTVSDGAIYIENEAGRLNLDPSEFGCVTSVSSSPVLLLKPPVSLTAEARALGGIDESDDDRDSLTKTSTRTRSGGDSSEFINRNETTTTSTPAEYNEPTVEVTAGGTDLTGGEAVAATRSVTVALPFEASNERVFGQRGEPGSVEVDGAGNLAQVESNDGTTYAIGSSSTINTGQDAASGLRWGRWAGNDAQRTPPAGGAPQPVNLTDSSLHWVVGPTGNGDVAIPITGSRNFTVIGNTSPTDGNGNVGTFGNATLSANFTNSSVESSVNFSLNGQVWSGDLGTGAITGSTFNGDYADVTVGPAGTTPTQGSGEFSGFFTPNADAAGLSYGLEANGPAGAPDRASGVVIFSGN